MNESNQIIFDHITKAIENMKNKGWETRYGQETLMYDVFDAYDSRENLIVEAASRYRKIIWIFNSWYIDFKSTKNL